MSPLVVQVCFIHSRKTTQVEVPSGSDLWSDRARRKYPLIRLNRARNIVCALSALERVSDQTLPDGKDLWSDLNQTIVKTIVRPWPRSNPDHRPDDCALKISSDQTIVRSKVTPDQTIVRSKVTLDQTIVRSKSLHRTSFVIIYSFHTK